MINSAGSLPPIMVVWMSIAIIFTIKTTFCHPIVNGFLPRDPHQFSFAVSLQRVLRNGTLMHFCGGTYLGAGWILTANHCIIGSTESATIYAYIGGLPLGTGNGSNLYRVREAFSNPNYNGVTLGGDIALLRFSAADHESSLQLLDEMVSSTLLLASSSNPNSNSIIGILNLILDDSDASGEECHIFGYGSECFYGPISDRLQYGPMQLMSFDRCLQMLGPAVAPATPHSGMFCAIGISDACRGDSGSGLVCRRRTRRPFENNGEVRPYTLRGIVSYGAGCAPASPGVYTDVGFYRRWIDERMLSNHASNA